MLNDFFDTIVEDPRIGSTHIVVYLALVHIWQIKGCPNSLTVATTEVLQYTKFRKRETYLKRVKDMADFGYLQYFPAENEYVKAEFRFNRLV